MLDQELKPDDLLRHLQDYRERLSVQVDGICNELDNLTRRNAVRIDASIAQIEAIIRDYNNFVGRLNQLRSSQENSATDAHEVLEMRRFWGDVFAKVNLFRTDLNQWTTISALVREQRKLKRRKLYQPEPKHPDTTVAQLGASDDVFDWLHAMLNPADQSEHADAHSCFPDIALANSVFHSHLHAAYRVVLAQRRDDPVRFLDVGCGGGLKVLSALRYFDRAHGFDFDPAYVQAGKNLMKLGDELNCAIFEQDAVTFEHYDQFDVIYFYRPISDEALLIEMEKKIVETARPGTVLIAPYVSFPGRSANLNCGHIDGAVYVSGISQKQADNLRVRAQRIGHYIIRKEATVLSSIWSPLKEMSRRNGFDVPHRYAKPKH